MSSRVWRLFQQLCRLPEPISQQFSGHDQSNPLVSERLRTFSFLGSILVVVSFGWTNVATGDSSDSEKSAPLARVDVQQSEFERLMAIARDTRDGTGSKVRRLSIDGRPAIGAEDAPLILIEIASFECQYCRRHWINTMPALRQRYIDSHQLRYVFVDVAIDPQHQDALALTEAAHCANEQGQYAAFRNRIFRHQKATDPAFLEAHAQAIALDLPEFRHCLASGRYKTQVDDDTSLARTLRVRGTPSFFWAQAEPGHTDVRLIRQISGARPIEEFARQFDVLRKRNQATTATLINSRR